jgi:hypothetical protein
VAEEVLGEVGGAAGLRRRLRGRRIFLLFDFLFLSSCVYINFPLNLETQTDSEEVPGDNDLAQRSEHPEHLWFNKF